MKNKYGGTSTTFQREYLREIFIDFNDKELLYKSKASEHFVRRT